MSPLRTRRSCDNCRTSSWRKRPNITCFPSTTVFQRGPTFRTKPNYLHGKTRFTYLPGTVRIPETGSPPTKNVHHTIAASVEIKDGDEGVLACCGGKSAGYTFFIKDARLHWEHNWFRKPRYRVSSKDKIPAGKRILSAEITVDKENAVGGGGKVTLRMGEKVIGESRCERSIPLHGTGELRHRLRHGDPRFRSIRDAVQIYRPNRSGRGGC